MSPTACLFQKCLRVYSCRGTWL